MRGNSVPWSQVAAFLLISAVCMADESVLITPNDGAEDDFFGFSVAISGDTVVIGSRKDDPCGLGTDCGSAYVFERPSGEVSGWNQIIKLTAFDGASEDFLGSAADIDNDTIVVSADRADTTATDSGAVYLFERDQSPTPWGYIKKVVGSQVSAGSRFGASLDLEGDLLAVTSKNNTYIFERDLGGSDNWGERIWFEGGSVSRGAIAILGDTLAVGYPAANDACPPAEPDCRAGAVEIRQRDLGGVNNWGLLTRFTAPDATTGAKFGTSLSLDGNTLVVGANHAPSLEPLAGAVYIFERDLGGTDNWGFSVKVVGHNIAEQNWFGDYVDLSGDMLVVGARHAECEAVIDSGAAYVFIRNLGGFENWGQIGVLCNQNPQDGDLFGAAVSVDSQTIIVGARTDDEGCSGNCNSGSASIFFRDITSFIFSDGFELGDASAWSDSCPPACSD